MNAAREPMIVASGACKSFGASVALDHVDLAVTQGTVFALLGPADAATKFGRVDSNVLSADGPRTISRDSPGPGPDRVRRRRDRTLVSSELARR